MYPTPLPREIVSLSEKILQNDSKVFGSAQLRQGVITAIDVSTETCSLNFSGDMTNVVVGVSTLHSYAPLIGDVVWILKNGSDLLVIGPVASSPGYQWTPISYPTGWSTWSGFPDLAYKPDGLGRVWFRGGVSVAASNGTGVKFTMPTGFRPAVQTQIMIPITATVNFTTMQRFAVDTGGGWNMLVASPSSTTFFSFDQASYPTA
jgi:hypothetical protein